MSLETLTCLHDDSSSRYQTCLMPRQSSSHGSSDFSRQMLKPDFSHPRPSDLPSRRLISTDAAARGIDISGVKCVVNYDAPQFVRTYVHR